ncbi:MAG: hypothetical protein KIT09_14005 [Bryobacteraceae bacterium]|nr:hypothetical protein [Bryobacteraceae bacterium]
MVHLDVFSTAHHPVRPQRRFKDGAHQSQPRTIEPVPEKQNDGRVVIQGQIAVGKRDCHPPIIWVLTTENLRRLYVDTFLTRNTQAADLNRSRRLCRRKMVNANRSKASAARPTGGFLEK